MSLADIKGAVDSELGKFDRKTKINDKEFTIKVLKGLDGYSTGLRLLDIILPVIGGTIDGVKHDDFLHGTPKTFSDLAVVICGQIHKIGVEELTLKLLEGLKVDGKQVDFDEYFAANYGELVELLEFALRENFQSLFMGKGIKARLMGVFHKIMGQTPDE